MQTIEQAATQALDAPRERPLRNLTKDQLFRYLKADDSTQAQWAFTHEVLQRRQAYEDTHRKANDLHQRAEAAWQAYANAADETYSKILKAQAERLEADAKVAKEAIAKLPDNDKAITQAELAAYYRAEYLPQYEAILKRWEFGDLFHAQPLGWASFLLETKKQRWEDEQAFTGFQNMAQLAGEEKTAKWKEIKAFYQTRILPSIERRQAFLTDEGQLANVRAMPDEKQGAYYRWAKEFNRMTRQHQWADDSGVAYTEPEERA